jgi:hypothetical protein
VRFQPQLVLRGASVLDEGILPLRAGVCDGGKHLKFESEVGRVFKFGWLFILNINLTLMSYNQKRLSLI